MIRPEFTYDPENDLLTICTGLTEDGGEILATLAGQTGINALETDGLATISVYVAARFGPNGYNSYDISPFLEQLRFLLPIEPQDDEIDRVAHLTHISEHGLSLTVGHQLQRWLNARGLTEEVARQTLRSMALTLGEKSLRNVAEHFAYTVTGADQIGSALPWYVSNKSADHSVHRQGTERDMIVPWHNFYLKTFGNCVCLGTPDSERHGIVVQQLPTGLYEASSHNIESANDTLSLLLGLATLVHYATQYIGKEDL